MFYFLIEQAIIWAIMKCDSVTYKKAELKYKQGFKQTQEELDKQRCNEILNKLPKADDSKSVESFVTDLSKSMNNFEEGLLNLDKKMDESNSMNTKESTNDSLMMSKEAKDETENSEKKEAQSTSDDEMLDSLEVKE